VRRHVLLTLAMLAVAIKVLIPPGFMTTQRTNDLPFALVMCTGQGAMVIQPGDQLPSKTDHGPAPSGKSHDSPCVFAGNALGAPPPALFDAAQVEFIAYAIQTSSPASYIVPGRGLAGPPLPARGPPSLLI
jgi:hypothetical protein